MVVYTNLLVVANVYTCWIKMIKPFAVLLCLNTAYKPNKNAKYKKMIDKYEYNEFTSRIQC